MSDGGNVQVTLSAKDQQLRSALAGSTNSIEAFGQSVGKSVQSSMMKFAALATAAVAAYKAIKAAINTVIGSLQSWWQAYAQQMEAEAKLTAALRATGQEVDANSKKLKMLASDLQTMTRYGDEALMPLMAMATQLGVGADQMDDAMRAAIGLAEATGMGLEQAIRAVVMAQEGHTEMLGRVIPEIRGLTDEQEKLDAVNKMATAGWQQHVEMTETQIGTYEQLMNRVGDLGELLGEILAPAVEWATEIFEHMVTWMEANIGIFQGWGAGVMAMGKWLSEFLAPIVEKFINGAIMAYSALQVAIENWQDSAKLVMLSYVHSVVSGFNIVKHWLTRVIPDLLMWFGRNWFEIFTDIGNATAKIFENMWKNVTMFFKNVWNWLSGKETEWEWTGLLEGFEATLDELPVIADRKIDGFEASLKSRMDELSVDLATKVARRYEENKISLGEFTASPKKAEEIVERQEKLRKEPVKLEISDAAREKTEKKREAEEKSEKPEETTASFEALDALNKRIQAAAAGSKEQAAVKKTEKNTADTAKASTETQKNTAKTTDVLTKIYNLLSDVKTSLPLVGTYGR